MFLQTHRYAARSPPLLLLIVALRGCLAAFSTSTSSFIGELELCATAAKSDVDCVSPLKVGLTHAQTFIQDVHDVRGRLQQLNSAISTVRTLLELVSVVPQIRLPAKALDQTLSRTVKPTVDRAYNAATRIDDKLWPHKSRVDSLLKVVDRAQGTLSTVGRLCTEAATQTKLARDCISSMPSGSLRAQLGSAAEGFSSKIQGPVHSAVQAMSTSGTACSKLRSFASRSWPNLASTKSSLDSVSRNLDPILKGLQKLKEALGKQVCIPTFFPLEVRRRKRNVLSDNDTADASAEFASVSASLHDAHVLQKRNWCVSVQTVINAAGRVLESLLRPAQEVLDRALSGLPSLHIPGLPDFTLLVSFDASFSVPSLEIELDFTRVDPLTKMDAQCPIKLSVSCKTRVAPSSASLALCSKALG